MWLEHAPQAIAARIGNGGADVLRGRTRRPGFAREWITPTRVGGNIGAGGSALILKDADSNPTGKGALRELPQCPACGALSEGIVLVRSVAEARKTQLRRLLRGEDLLGTPAAQK